MSAVKWLVNELLYLDNEFDMNLIDKNEYQEKRRTIIKQAEEMEKEQIIKAFDEGESLGDRRNYTGIVYCTETFKSE